MIKVRKVKIEDYEQVINLYQQLYDAEKVFDINMNKNYKIRNSDIQKKKVLKRIKNKQTLF